MIKIRLGSIFDQKCDLLVIPCSSGGSMTPIVFRELQARGLPTSFVGIPFGSVHFLSVNYENAAVLAFAASVDHATHRAEAAAIRNIAKELVAYCRKNQISLVNVPLLGTGAGGMTPAESFEILRGQFDKDRQTTFSISCMTTEIYENLAVKIGGLVEADDVEPPRVFISYTGLDPKNAAWVRSLGEVLRQNGINARLDQFHLRAGSDLPQWMTNEVIMAEKVLLVCDSHYMEKADFRKGGVGWETMIIQGDMLAQGGTAAKYIAIIRGEPGKVLPTYMRSKYALNWGGQKGISKKKLNDLLLILFDRENEPPLGRAPEFVRRAKKKMLNT